jgi:UDP-N-acetylglucosamine pyrophosphorylase
MSLVSSTPATWDSDIEHASERDVVRYQNLPPSPAAFDAIQAGQVAFVVLSGGRGTRVGGPKPFMRLPSLGITLISNKLAQSLVTTPWGQLIEVPIWFMTSPDLMKRFELYLNGISPLATNTIVFEQFESYRLRPDNRLDFVSPGVPDMYPLGHGDVGPALVESGVLDENPNVKYCYIVNCDNVLASPDPYILSHHIESGAKVTCEVIDRNKNDQGGVIVWNDNKLQVVESFRLPDGLIETAPFHNTNSMIINVDVLRTELPWRWYRVRKQVDKRLVIQYERLIQQYTQEFDAQYVVVPREQRYLPIKTEADLMIADHALNGNRNR